MRANGGASGPVLYASISYAFCPRCIEIRYQCYIHYVREEEIQNRKSAAALLWRLFDDWTEVTGSFLVDFYQRRWRYGEKNTSMVHSDSVLFDLERASER